MESKRIIALFDVDGTLTPARTQIQDDMLETLTSIQEKGVILGIVSGSDIKKMHEQLQLDCKPDLSSHLHQSSTLWTICTQKTA